MKQEYSFDEFIRSSKDEWLTRAESDLKGKFPIEKLNWQLTKEIQLSPFHHAEDHIPSGAHQGSYTSLAPDHQSAGWLNLQVISAMDEKFSEWSAEALNNGADGLILDEVDMVDMDNLFKVILPEHCHIGFILRNHSSEIVRKYVDWIEKEQIEKPKLQGLIFNTPLEPKVLQGAADFLSSNDAELVEMTDGLDNVRAIMIDGAGFQESGAEIVTQTGLVIASMVEKINALMDEGLSMDSIAGNIFLNLSVGGSFFDELAKLKATRYLVQRVLARYGAEGAQCSPHIHVNTTMANKSALDPNTNLLRSTSEAMAAVLGGADSLYVLPYDETRIAPRIARNVSNILKEEAYLDKVVDPAAGSYYIESLVSNIARASWSYFQELQAMGGLSAALSSGHVWSRIEKERTMVQGHLSSGKKSMIGVNNYGNTLEERIFGFEGNRINTDFFEFRAAGLFERRRDSLEKLKLQLPGDKQPVVVPVVVGTNGAMRSARVNFILNFFSWAGFNVRHESEVDAVKGGNSNTIYVFCGADEDYETIADDVKHLAATNPRSLIYIAGRAPEQAGEWMNQIPELRGVIDRKSDRLAVIDSIIEKCQNQV